MPIYEFLCVSCTARENKEHPFYIVAKEPPTKKLLCPDCGSEKTMRAWNVPTVKFSGPGFYSTDNSKESGVPV